MTLIGVPLTYTYEQIQQLKDDAVAEYLQSLPANIWYLNLTGARFDVVQGSGTMFSMYPNVLGSWDGISILNPSVLLGITANVAGNYHCYIKYQGLGSNNFTSNDHPSYPGFINLESIDLSTYSVGDIWIVISKI